MIDAAVLDRIGDVPPGYVHHARPTEAGPPLVTRDSVFKWYRVFPATDPVSPALDDDARRHVLAFLAEGKTDPAYGMGFVVLHHSTEFDFLFVCSWRGHQELWDSLFYRAVGDVGEWSSPDSGSISPVCCVWEMAPMWHERNAWVRYLGSDRARDARLAWLDDTAQGLL